MKIFLPALCVLVLTSFRNEGESNTRNSTYANNCTELELCIPKNVANRANSRKVKAVNDIDFALVCHSNLIVLEYFEQESFESNIEINKYPKKTSLLHLYKIEDAELISKYEKLIGTQVYVNDHFFKRKQFELTIIDIVLVHDLFQDRPYVAAVTDIDKEDYIYYAWVSSSKSDLEKYGDKLTKDYNYGDELDSSYNELISRYKSSSYFKNQEEVSETSSDINEYARIDVSSFQSKFGDFYIVENKRIGTCEFLSESQTVVYKKQGNNYELIAKSIIGQELIDLIDIDNDGIPELLTGEFSSSAIYKISNGKLINLKSASWSFMGCPC